MGFVWRCEAEKAMNPMRTVPFPLSNRARFSLPLTVMFLLLSAVAFPVGAAPRSWTGNAASGNWSAANNWFPVSPPQSGDELTFPAGLPAADLLSTNDLINLRLASITFTGSGGGFFLRGNSIILSNGVNADQILGANAIDFDFILGRSQSFFISNPTSGLIINGDINLNGFTLSGFGSGTNNFLGVISGTGSLRFGGHPVLGGINSPNTFIGETRMVGGTLQLNRMIVVSTMPFVLGGGVSVPGDLFIEGESKVIVSAPNQIADTATVTLDYTSIVEPIFELDNVNDCIAALIMKGGKVRTGTGTLTNGNITASYARTGQELYIQGNLHLGNSTRTFDVSAGLIIFANIAGGFSGPVSSRVFAGITKTGRAGLQLSGDNTYDGTTVVDEGSLDARSNTAFGSTQGGVIISPAGNVSLREVDIGDELLTINRPSVSLGSSGVNSWSGPIVLNIDTTFTQLTQLSSADMLALSNSISGPGGLTLIGPFRFAGANANTYAGTTTLNRGELQLGKTSANGAINGPLVIDNSISTGTAVVRLLRHDQIANSVPITINAFGLLDGNGFDETIGALTLDGGRLDSGPFPGTFFLNAVTANDRSLAPASIAGQISLTGFFPTFNVTSESASEPDLDVFAQILGSEGLIKNGPGQLTLSASNFYGGVTIINDGEVIVSHSFALGRTNDGTRVFDNALLTVRSNSHVGLESLTLNGVGDPNLGALHSIAGSNSWRGNITLSSDTVVTVANNFLHLSGVISGPGDLTKQGPGTLIFSGSSANAYSGATTINAGQLRLGKSAGVTAVPGALVIGDDLGGAGADSVRLLEDNQIANGAAITLNSSGFLNLDTFDDTVGPLTFNGGDISMLTGSVLTAAGDFTVNYNPASLSRITGGQLAFNATRTINVTSNAVTSPELFIASGIVGAGGLIKNGPGEVELAVSNSFNGLTTINDGWLSMGDDYSLGSPGNGTTVNGDGVLILGLNVRVPQEPLALNSLGQAGFGALFSRDGSNSWAGPIDLQTNTTIHVEAAPDDLALSGIISGRGRLNKEGAGTLIFSGVSPNNYTNLTIVEEGMLVLGKQSGPAVPGDLIIGDGLGAALSAAVRLDVVNAMRNSEVIVLSDGLLDMNDKVDAIGSLAGVGQVDLGAGSLFAGQNDATTSYSGLIIGAGSFTKQGAGIMILDGNNTYSGNTTIEEGRLTINGNQPRSRIRVNAAGTLGGRGTVGLIDVLGGIVAPGSSPAILTSSNVVFNAASEFNVEINGSNPGSGYDQLNVRGTNNLAGATLNVSVGPTFIPADGEALTIINNDGSDAIVGTFAGLPNGALLSASGVQFRILTNGGTGNDVVLMVTNIALALNAEPVVSTGNGIDQIEPGECNLLRVALRNRISGSVSGVSATLSSTNPGVTITQPFSTYPNVPGLGIRSNTSPFQVSTSPGLLCGTNIDFVLTVTTATNGTFKVPFRMHAGTPGSPTRLNNDADLAIPDLGSVDSLINVNGFAGVLGRVTVSLHLTHTADGDLDLSLVGPDGTIVNLSSDNGGTFDDYGTSVADADRTLFTETAGVAIAAGQPPFRGAFLPEQPLAAFRGKFGAEVNGTWRLRINDDASGGTGTLRAWSLFLWPMVCRDGGGECEQCGGPFIGSITAGDSIQNNRLFLDGSPSECASPDTCPGQSGGGTIHYDTYTFTNAGPESCVTVTLASPCTVVANRISSAAYLGSYNPANKCNNYLGDLGSSTSFETSYSFVVPPNSAFIVIVNETTSGGGCTNYTLHVTGFDCPQPLGIEPLPANRVRLTWSTSAAEYQLVSTNAFRNPPNAFGPVAVEPIVVDSKYTVTNTISGPARFFELRKP
jgi:autotransporter-associated beta strand protein